MTSQTVDLVAPSPLQLQPPLALFSVKMLTSFAAGDADGFPVNLTSLTGVYVGQHPATKHTGGSAFACRALLQPV